MAGKDVVGKARFVTEVDPSGVDKGLDEATRKLKSSGDEAEKTATAQASRATAKFASIGKAGVVALSGAVAGAMGMAARGAMEMEGIQADFQAATGASAEEAKRFGQTVNDMSRSNVQSLEEIADAGTRVRTDLGLTGDEADKVTQKFLSYARATSQDAAGAVLAFDDILDAWNLTAEQSGGVMDQLVASHQRFGGSIEANQEALATMAPALQAMNLTVDDGIGLLNMFAANGLDASAAQRALNTAITKLPKGESLKEFLARMGAIEDPTARAREAVKVFGSQAGPKLANAIAPGKQALDDYVVTAGDVEGASDKARQAMDDTFGTQLDLIMKDASAAIRGLGMEFGPAGSLIVAITSAAPLMLGPLKTLGGLMGDTIGASLAEKAAAMLVAAGLPTGALGLAAAGMVLSIPVAIVLISRLGDADVTSGKNLIGAYAGAGGIPVAITPYVTDDARKQAAHELASVGIDAAHALANRLFADEYFAKGGYELQQRLGLTFTEMRTQLEAKMAETGQGLGDVIAGWGQYTIPSMKNLWTATIPGAKGVQDDGYKTAMAYVTGVLQGMGNAALTTENRAAIINTRWWQAKGAMAAAAAYWAGDETGKAYGTGAMMALASDGFREQFAIDTRIAVAKATNALALMSPAFRDQIHEARDTARAAMDDLMWAIEHPMKRAKRVAEIEGDLTGKALARALRSRNPDVRAEGERVRAVLIQQWEQLTDQTWDFGLTTAQNLARGIKRNKPAVAGAAGDVADAAKGPISKLATQATNYGTNYGKNLAAGMRSQVSEVRDAAGALARATSNQNRISSPAKEGPWSLGGGPEGWGVRYGQMLARGMLRARGEVAAAAGTLAGTASMDGYTLDTSSSRTVNHQVSGTVQVELSPSTIAAARDAGASWEDVGRMAGAANLSDVLAAASRSSGTRYLGPAGGSH